jgi:hypothetical protein
MGHSDSEERERGRLREEGKKEGREGGRRVEGVEGRTEGKEAS